MAITYAAEPYQAHHTEMHLGITERAYANHPAHARPELDAAFHRQLHGGANPAGAALMMTAREDGHCVGVLSSIPMRFKTRAGIAMTGYQGTALAVDPGAQAQFIGLRLSRLLIRSANALSNCFPYGYPNRNAHRFYVRAGSVLAQVVPTYVFPRTPCRASYKDPSGMRWTFEAINSPDELDPSEFIDSPLAIEGFVRDRAYFDWRFGGDAAARYRFVFCRAEEKSSSFIVACTEHRMSGFPFTILVEGYPSPFLDHFAIAVRAATLTATHKTIRFVYATTNLARRRPEIRWPKGVEIPTRFHPRPFELYAHPEGAAPTDEVGLSLALTGDWLGF
ncbi:MAG: hypothetical protein AAF384_06730 [Pseudomonadota bacterium]